MLGGADDEASPHFAAGVAMTARGADTTYWLSPTYEDGVVHGYGTDGAIRSSIGGAGEGPGELGGLAPLVLQPAGATLLVGSQVSTRLTRFDDAGGGATVEALPWPVQDVVTLTDGRLLLVPNAPAEPPTVWSGVGDMRPVVAPDSVDLRDHGVVLIASAVGDEASRLAWLATVADGRIYSIGEDLAASFAFAVPPSAFTLSESDGVLWVGLLIRQQELQPGTAFGPGVADSVFDTRLVALDPTDGRTLASYDDPRALRGVAVEAGVLFSHVVETDAGDTRIRILRPRLVPSAGR